MTPAQRIAVLNRPVQLHDGISYSALTGVAYAKVPGGTLTKGGLTDVFTFTGGSTSYYMGSGGLLIPAVTNTPRIEYDVSGNILGLLIENSITNQLLHSRDQTNAAWVKTTMTAAKDQVGVDGVANGASSLLATGAGALSLQTIVQAAASSTFSFWIKRLVGTGTVGIAQDGVTFTTTTLTTAWQQFQLTATQLNPVLGFKLSSDTDKIAVDFGQFEAGAFATSVIPTTTASVTRAAENCTRTLGAEFSAAAGTTIVAARHYGTIAAFNQFLYMIDDGTLNERFHVSRTAAAGATRFQVTDGGAAQCAIDQTGIANNINYKVGAAWAANDFASCTNGGAVGTDAAGTLPTVTTLRLGSRPGPADALFGYIRSFDYYPSRLSNAFLQQASS